MDLLPLWSALAAGALAIAAATAAQRLMHVWDVKQDHRDDLARDALRPWLEETGRLLEYVRHHALGRYVTVYLQPADYAFRTNFGGTPRPFPENWPIWEKACEHWPHLARAWADLEERQRSLDIQVQNFLSHLVSLLPSPPTGLEWQRDMEGDPEFGKRWVACEFWRLYWESQEHREDDWKRFEEQVASQRWLSSKNQPLSRELSEMAKNFFYGPDREDELDHIGRQASTIEGRLLEFKQELQRVAYNKNLARNCDYCPRFFAKSRFSYEK